MLLSVWQSTLMRCRHKEQLRLNGHACVMQINAALRPGNTIDPFCRNQLYTQILPIGGADLEFTDMPASLIHEKSPQPAQVAVRRPDEVTHQTA